MKILQINASYKPAYIYGGPTVSVAMLSELLAKKDHHIEVFTTTANGKKELPVLTNIAHGINGVSVTYFKRLSKDHSHFSPALLAALWKEASTFELIHIHTWWNTVSIFSCLIALLKGIPVVLSPRGTLSYYSFNNRHKIIKYLFHRLAGKFLLNRCHIHTTSRREHLRIIHLLKPASTFSIYNVVPLSDLFSPPDLFPLPDQTNTSGIAQSPLKLLFISRIEPKKGLELFLRTLAGLSIPFRLSIAGDGAPAYIKYLKTIIQQLKIGSHIHWLGFSGKDKFQLMAQHQVMVLPSSDENFGNVVIESLSVGTAVLVSNKVGLASYVRKNNFGWVCQLHKNSVKACLENIHQSPNILQSIRESAPAQIASDFNTDKLLKQYTDNYEQTLFHHRPNL